MRFAHVEVLLIGDNAYDFELPARTALIVGQREPLPECAAVEVRIGERLGHDCNTRRASSIARVEVTSSDKGSAERRKVAVADRVEIRLPYLPAIDFDLAIRK